MASSMDPFTTPGMEPPAGHTPDFDAPYNSLQIGTCLAFGITYFLATVCLALRYFQAFKLIKKVEVDLVAITVSYGVALAYFITMVKLMGHGWGKHMYDVSVADLMEFNKALLPNTLMYLITPSITKMAILSVLYRINPSSIYRFVVIVVTVAIFAYTLTLCTITGAPCNPLHAGTTTCLMNVALSHAVLNIASDLAVIALPIPTIMNLHLSLKQKLTIGSLLALGSGVTICSIARLPYVLLLSKTPDTTYTEAILGVWSLVEVNLGIICACAMRFKKLLAAYLPRLSLFSSRSRSHSKSQSHTQSAAKVGSYKSYLNRLQPQNSKIQHTYQLHSIQNDGEDPFTGSRDISVHHSFGVDVDGSDRDNRSTRKILS